MREKYHQLTTTKESIEKHKLELEAIVQQKTNHADALEKEVCISTLVVYFLFLSSNTGTAICNRKWNKAQFVFVHVCTRVQGDVRTRLNDP